MDVKASDPTVSIEHIERQEQVAAVSVSEWAQHVASEADEKKVQIAEQIAPAKVKEESVESEGIPASATVANVANKSMSVVPPNEPFPLAGGLPSALASAGAAAGVFTMPVPSSSALAAVVLPSNVQPMYTHVKVNPPMPVQIANMRAPPCPVGYRDPTFQEKAMRQQLVGSQITIFWDGEGTYFPAKVVSFDEKTQWYKVVYLTDLALNPRPEYDEDLRNVSNQNLVWKIWSGIEQKETRKSMPSRTCKPEAGSGVFNESLPRTRAAVPDANFTQYEHMCVEAVLAIAHKKGTSLQAIRKYIEKTYNLGHMQPATFNKKTLDGVNTGVANQRLERVHQSTFKVTNGEKLRRKQLVEQKKRKVQAEMRGDTYGGVKLRVGGAHDKDAYELNIIGTAAEFDKNMRNMLISTRVRRDKSLLENFDILRPFLPEKNYFEKVDASGQVVKVTHTVAPVKIAVSEVQEFAGIARNAALNGVQSVGQPTTLTATLHKHQLQGISWMAHMYLRGMPMILGDQMGLGKTIQTIGFFTWLQTVRKSPGPYLVVVPLSVLPNWMTEFERFAPTFRVVRFHGPKDERNRMKFEEMSSISDFDVVVTTYEIVVAEVNWIRKKYLWAAIVVDEGHRLKNEKSQLSEKLRTVPTLSRVILTGTPLQNNLREMWALLHYLSPDVFNNATSERFVEAFDAVSNQIDTGTLRLARRLLGVFMLRRLKDHVAITLPSRKEVTLLVPLTGVQIALYKHLLCGDDGATVSSVMSASTEAEEGNRDTFASSSSSLSSTEIGALKKSSSSTAISSHSSDTDWKRLMNLLLQLRKICNHVYLMPDVAPDPYAVTEDIVQGSGKLLMLDRILPRLRSDGHRVLIFSQFTSMLDILEDYCELRDLPFVRLDGETNRVQRRLDCRRYNAVGSLIFIFLISTRAGGLGLNLASADTVILYDSDWNPQVDLQAMERAHRIGQTKPVRIFRLVCSGSVEERMVNRAEKKLYLNAMVAESGEEVIDDEGELVLKDGDAKEGVEQALGIGGAVMSKQELASLIRFGANAVISGDQDTHISDSQLDHLLERKGRDLPQGPLPGDNQSLDVAHDAGPDAVMQATLRLRMQNLKEIDIRQLGSTHYGRGAASSVRDGDFGVHNIIDNGSDDDMPGKRDRKQRITMIDGRGTGYGGAIPMLADSFDLSSAPVATVIQRNKAWTHQTWCAFCGKGKHPGNLVKCAHCPKVFHDYCLEEVGIPRGNAMFICPHHKCAMCTRSTASAGGLLFRCKGCLTSFCEDCLPQDEVESIGRCRELEYLGYSSKQSYYIKCGTCCAADGFVPTGVDGDVHTRASVEPPKESVETEKPVNTAEKAAAPGMASTGNAEAGEEQHESVKAGADVLEEQDVEEDEEDEILFTQQLRVHWEMLPDSEEEREREEEARRAQRRRKRKDSALNRSNKRRSSADGRDDSGDEGGVRNRKLTANGGSDEDCDSVAEMPEEVDEYFKTLVLGDAVGLDQALDIVMSHPAFCTLQADHADVLQEGAAILSSICNKLSEGRYRNARSFSTDLAYWLVQIISASTGGAKSGGSGGRASKRAASSSSESNASAEQLLMTVLNFFKRRVQGLLVI